MKILAIESSCDELAISVLENGRILANIVSSQIKNHALHGGVIPELAARLHLKNLAVVIEQLVAKTQLDWKTLDYIAYTKTPGLLGSLMVGKIMAETLGLYWKKPLLALNHLEGHIFGATIERDFAYPILALVVSGGHTQLVFVKSVNTFEVLGSTVDDAFGECYDKVARSLGFPYPGGASIDQTAQKGNPQRYKLPLAKDDASYDFSYSGLKTAALNLYQREKEKSDFSLNDFCASFQNLATTILEKKLDRALDHYPVKTLIVAGGASANSLIRKQVQNLGLKHHIPYILIPDLAYCTDNAAMIAKLAWEKIKE